MNVVPIGSGSGWRSAMAARSAPATIAVRENRARSAAAMGDDVLPAALPADALDDRIAIVGTAGSGKTYAAKGFVERLLETGARVAIVDPLGVWWGLRAIADGGAAGLSGRGIRRPPCRRGDHRRDGRGPWPADRRPRRLRASSISPSSAAMRRGGVSWRRSPTPSTRRMRSLCTLCSTKLISGRRSGRSKAGKGLLGHIEEIVRRGRVRGFIPWLITQRPAVVHKDVLCQADILIAMKLTASQDRDAIGGWIEGQADRQEGKRILGDLPRLRAARGICGRPAAAFLNAPPFRRSAPSTARARPSVANAWLFRARLRRST